MKRPFVQFPVDGPEEGEEPDEWDMEVERPDEFVDKVIRKRGFNFLRRSLSQILKPLKEQKCHILKK